MFDESELSHHIELVGRQPALSDFRDCSLYNPLGAHAAAGNVHAAGAQVDSCNLKMFLRANQEAGITASEIEQLSRLNVMQSLR